ncbi:hypothetical protein T484DRAFT_1843002 [Baffinella frigidus]|nr:hypothetical protein T484DRAFT_1843002 [Cryptophyta sp. CCMP2293]
MVAWKQGRWSAGIAAGALVSLRVLFFLRNSFSSLPPSLASLPSLETLSFKLLSARVTGHADAEARRSVVTALENKLSSLEPSHLPRSLRALILTSNRLSSIPPGLSGLLNLQKLMASAQNGSAWNSPAGRLVNARVTGHADAEANCPR